MAALPIQPPPERGGITGVDSGRHATWAPIFVVTAFLLLTYVTSAGRVSCSSWMQTELCVWRLLSHELTFFRPVAVYPLLFVFPIVCFRQPMTAGAMGASRPKSRTKLAVLAFAFVCILVGMVAFSQDLASHSSIRLMLPSLLELAPKTQACAPAFDRPVAYLPLPSEPNCTRTYVKSMRQVLLEEYPAWHAAHATNASVPVLVFRYEVRGVPRSERNRGGLGDVFKFMAPSKAVVARGRAVALCGEAARAE